MNFVLNSSSVRSGSVSGLQATFTCVVDSWPPAQVEWSYINSSRISIETSRPSPQRQVSTLTVSSVELGDQGVFTCNATSQFGSISSSANLDIFGELD